MKKCSKPGNWTDAFVLIQCPSCANLADPSEQKEVSRLRPIRHTSKWILLKKFSLRSQTRYWSETKVIFSDLYSTTSHYILQNDYKSTIQLTFRHRIPIKEIIPFNRKNDTETCYQVGFCGKDSVSIEFQLFHFKPYILMITLALLRRNVVICHQASMLFWEIE